MFYRPGYILPTPGGVGVPWSGLECLPTQALPPPGGGRHPPFSRVPGPTHGYPQKPYPDPYAYVYMAKNTPATSLRQ